MKITRYLPLIVFLFTIVIFARPFIFRGLLPIPADTIVGLYHPFRDLYAPEYPRGVPYKNSLITDPVRQQYPWRLLSIDSLQKLELPLWNPYAMAGTPLLGNFQSASMYPPNILFAFIPFSFAWSVLVVLQPILAGIFLYLYLRNLKIDTWSAVFGALAFSFSGFFIAWFEWNTVGHVALWLPLILFSIDKVYSSFKGIFNFQFSIFSSRFTIRKYYIWLGIVCFSLVSSLLAGHLQTFFYVFSIQLVYFILRWVQFGKSKKILMPFAISYMLFAIVTAVQWIPTFQFILESARNIDMDWQKEGWFIPWQHLVQFIAPDFFGNPATLNYWGVWNYGEFVGYIGLIPLLAAVYAMVFRRDKKTMFFGGLFLMSLLFALPTFIAKIPFLLNIPMVSTAQPTRLLFVADFSLAVLAALGLNYYQRNKRSILYPIVMLGIVFGCLWIVVMGNVFSIQPEYLATAKRNLLLPTMIFVVGSVLLIIRRWIPTKYQISIITIIIFITIIDLLRFANKFTPFTNAAYLYPTTRTIAFLQKNLGNHRIMATDSRIFPPNFSSVYKIQTVDGYDPLYLLQYGELIAASERGIPNIQPPFGFNRIITPQRYDSRIIDLLGVKYVVSLTNLNSAKLVKVHEEGQTQVYQNMSALPRAFFVERLEIVSDKQEAIDRLFNNTISLQKEAIVAEDSLNGKELKQSGWKVGKVEIVSYNPNEIVIKTDNNGDGFLVLTDTYYPTWHATVDRSETDSYLADYTFRGVVVPKGSHEVRFYNRLF